MKRVFLGLGSNVGNRKKNIQEAIKLLSKHIKEIKVANFYLSKAVGYEAQDDFLNTAVEGFTELSPEDLLKFTKSVEKYVGRVYRFHWGPREIDIDILFYENLILDTADLKIPHPYLHERDFVLLPLMDLDKDFVHPVLNKKIKELVKDVKIKSVYGKL